MHWVISRGISAVKSETPQSADSVTVGQRIGYSRVSTVSQTLGQQNEALEAAGATKTFSDTMSGARDDRLAWPH